MSAKDESSSESELEIFEGRYEFFRVKSWREICYQFLTRLSESWPQAILRIRGYGDESVRESLPELPARMPDIGSLLLARDQESLSILTVPAAQAGASALTDIIALEFRAEGKNVAKLVLYTPQWAENDPFSERASRLLSETSGCEAYPDYGSMVPGGWDYLTSGVADAARAVASFLDEVVERWPGALIEMEESTTGASCRLRVCEWPSSLADEVVFLIARDSTMKEYWEETGGTPMPDGDGPLSLYAHKDSTGTWAMTLVTPAPAHDDEFSAWAVQILSAAAGRPVTLAADIDKDWPHPYSPEENIGTTRQSSELGSTRLVSGN